MSRDGAGHLHAVGPARPVRARDDRPRRGALARRRPRLRVRRPRPVRSLPGRPGRGQLPEARHRVERRAPLAARRRRGRVRPAPRARRRAAGSAAARRSRATSSSTSRPRARSTARSSARACRFATSSSTRSSRLHEVEVERPDLAKPGGDLARLLAALEREWGLDGLEADLEVIRELQPALERGRLQGHRRRPRRRASSPASGPGCTIGRSASRWTSARRRSPGTSRISPTARSSPRTA